MGKKNKDKHSIKFSNYHHHGYLPGSTIKGSVSFNFSSVTPAYELQVFLNGVEYACVMYTTTSHTGKSSRTMTHYDKADRNLCCVYIRMDTRHMIRDGNIQPGNYVLPFHVYLPKKCPPSMKYGLGSSECSVRYSISASITKKKGGSSRYIWVAQSFAVRGFPLSATAIPFRGEPEKRDVMFCCSDRGYMLFGAHVSDTLLDQGEEMNISMSCRNHTISKIKLIRARLLETIAWQGRSHSKDYCKTLVEKEFPYFPSLDRLKVRGTDQTMDTDLREMARELADCKYSASITCPDKAIPNFKGKLIRVTHSIEIKVKTGSCITDPEIRIPARVGPGRYGAHQKSNSKKNMQEEPINKNAIVATTVVVNESNRDSFVFGGATRTIKDTEDGEDDAQAAEAKKENLSASYENLIKEMSTSLDDYDIVVQKIQLPEWKPIFETLTTKKFGQIIKEVDYAFEQAPVAEEIAKVHKDFTCLHVVAAINNCFDWSKCNVIEKLVPYVKDLSHNKEQILNRLTEWEKINTESAFKAALG